MLTLAEEASSAPQTAVDTSQSTIILRRKAKNNMIIERVGNSMAPRCLVSKSETVQVEL